MIDRRRFFEGMAACMLTVSRPGLAQPTNRLNRVGVLRANAATRDIQTTAVPQALRELGYIEGQNLVLDQRFAAGRFERLPAFARGARRAAVDVIVAVTAVRSPRSRRQLRRFRSSSSAISAGGRLDTSAASRVPAATSPGILIIRARRHTGSQKRIAHAGRAGDQTRGDAVAGRPQRRARTTTGSAQAAAALAVELVPSKCAIATADALPGLSPRGPIAVRRRHVYFVTDRKPIIELAAKYQLLRSTSGPSRPKTAD
jgi:hypothetical protein